VGDKMTEMVELMMRDPGTQQLLLSKLPPHLRKPEVLRAMMANPEVKQRINALAQSTVRCVQGLAAAQAAGAGGSGITHTQLVPPGRCVACNSCE
jgi:hypothetical protein